MQKKVVNNEHMSYISFRQKVNCERTLNCTWPNQRKRKFLQKIPKNRKETKTFDACLDEYKSIRIIPFL